MPRSMMFEIPEAFGGHSMEGGIGQDHNMVYGILFIFLYGLLALVLLGVVVWLLRRIYRRLEDFSRTKRSPFE